MPLSPSAPLPASTSALASASAGAEYSGQTVSPTLSNVENVNGSMATLGLPTYDEAMIEANRGMQQSGANASLHPVPPGRNKLIGLWEAEKWRLVSDAISEFASSPIAAEGNFPAEKVNPVVSAIATWTNMVTQPPPMMKQGDPYYWIMDRAVTDALKQLGSLHNDLQAHARQVQPFNPSCSKHFIDMATKIHRFIHGMK